VVAATQFGAFLDWGLEKDLFVPFKEQNHKLQKGQYVPVYLYLDEQTDRVVASAKVHKYFKNLDGVDLDEGQEVDLLVFEKTELGHNVVVNNLYKGLVYENETFRRLAWGDTNEGKIDISLQPLGFLKTLEPNQKAILDKLQQSGGTLNLSDSSDPIEIQEVLEMSKKAFKKAIGVLYKDKKILIKDDSIVLNQTSAEK
jgi:predicted RNA-binding protein (virulence factor B family)